MGKSIIAGKIDGEQSDIGNDKIGGGKMKYNIFFYIICILIGMNFANALSNYEKLGSKYDLIIATTLAGIWILYTCPYIK